MDNVQIVSMNCRGLGNREKRIELFQLLRLKKIHICCLQDTHFVNADRDTLRREWGNDCFFSCKSSNSRGVAILFGEGVKVEILKIKEDNEGNFILLHIRLFDHDITLVSLYGPNTDSPQFYTRLENYILEFENPFTIMCGDWNFVQDFDLDTHNYVRVNNPTARNRVNQLKTNLGLIDPWREINPAEKSFTWRQPNPFKMARLDFFLISKEIMSLLESVRILPGHRTDHSMITLSLNFDKIDQGRGYWKFNNALLKDVEYCEKIKNLIKETIKMYSIDEWDPERLNFETYNFENHEFSINDQLFFETLLMLIRGETISYSSMKKKNFKQCEEKLEIEISKLESNLSDTGLTSTALEELEYKKVCLEDLRKQRIDESILRSKLKWMEFGEKPSKFFLNLEKQNYINRQMKKLIDEKGNIIQGKNVLHETFRFYSHLYEKKPVETFDWNDIADLNVPKLSSHVRDSLEGPLDMNEVFEVIKNMKNNKSPGLDGFTVEFMKFFWNYLKYFLVRSLNYAFLNGNLSYTQKLGVITLIPKGNKERHFLRNWRPISLLNVFYKIASSCIANRIKKTLSILIHESQKGFMSGRFIGENIRLLYDIMLYTDINDIPGLLLLIDFEKAFDSISHDFIMQALDYFNFGNDIKAWVKLFYEDAFSCVLVNGHLTNRFKVERGCRQGDPLSPYIFLICAEILSILVRHNNSLNGLNIRNTRHKIIQYADDTLISLDGSKEDLQEIMNILEKFALCSGLTINKRKTKAIWIGRNKNRTDKIHVQDDLEWVFGGFFRYLGIDFSQDLQLMVKQNYTEKIELIKSQISLWLKRSLTVLGRITVVKSLLISKLNYLFLSLPNPPDDVMKEIDSFLHRFIWEGKPDKISRNQMAQPYHLGGAKMINVHLHAQSLKTSWMRRLFAGTLDSYTYFLMNLFLPNNRQFNAYFGDNHYRQMAEETRNPFWKDVFSIFSKLQRIAVNNVSCQPLWKNNYIQVNNECVFYKSWYDKGITVVNDLLEDDGTFLTFNSFKQKYDLNVNFLQYFGMREAIKKGYDKRNAFEKMDQPLRPDIISLISKYKKGCSHIYSTFLARDKAECKSYGKWKLLFNMDENSWQAYCSIAFYSTIDIDLRWFQFRIIHRILFTNELLYKLKLVQSDLCSFCHIQCETIVHLFCECTLSNNIWSELEKWILLKTGFKIEFKRENILFGFQGQNNQALNCLSFVVKRTLYRNKVQNKIPYFSQFKSSITTYYKHEKLIADSKCRSENFKKKWISLANLFDT